MSNLKYEYYGYMNMSNLKWNESNNRYRRNHFKKLFFSLRSEQGTKSELKCFSFKYVKNFPTLLGKLAELESH